MKFEFEKVVHPLGWNQDWCSYQDIDTSNINEIYTEEFARKVFKQTDDIVKHAKIHHMKRDSYARIRSECLIRIGDCEKAVRLFEEYFLNHLNRYNAYTMIDLKSLCDKEISSLDIVVMQKSSLNSFGKQNIYGFAKILDYLFLNEKKFAKEKILNILLQEKKPYEIFSGLRNKMRIVNKKIKCRNDYYPIVDEKFKELFLIFKNLMQNKKYKSDLSNIEELAEYEEIRSFYFHE